jgi:hypothetical protein
VTDKAPGAGARQRSTNPALTTLTAKTIGMCSYSARNCAEEISLSTLFATTLLRLPRNMLVVERPIILCYSSTTREDLVSPRRRHVAIVSWPCLDAKISGEHSFASVLIPG